MYLAGFLFGLSFDTATEIGVLGIPIVDALSRTPVWSITVLSVLFVSGVALVGTFDSALMVGTYGWTLSKP